MESQGNDAQATEPELVKMDDLIKQAVENQGAFFERIQSEEGPLNQFLTRTLDELKVVLPHRKAFGKDEQRSDEEKRNEAAYNIARDHILTAYNKMLNGPLRRVVSEYGILPLQILSREEKVVTLMSVSTTHNSLIAVDAPKNQ